MQSLMTISPAALFRSFGFVPARMTSPMSWSLCPSNSCLAPLPASSFTTDLACLSNIWFLGLFGGPIERQLGRRKLLSLLIFIICCALTDLALRLNSVVPLVGASGLVAGLMGFFLVAYPRSRLLTVLPIAVPFPVKVPIAWFMAIWLSLQIAVLLMGPSFDVQSAWWIHLAGFNSVVFLASYQLHLSKSKARERSHKTKSLLGKANV